MSPEAELQWLTQALRGHLGWLNATGARGVMPLTDAVLEQRRAQYRALVPSDDAPDAQQPPAEPAQPQTGQPQTAQPHTGQPQTAQPQPAQPLQVQQPAAVPVWAGTAVASPAAPGAEPVQSASPPTTINPRPAPQPTLPTAPGDAAHAGAPLPLSAASRQRLAVLQTEVASCTRCRLHETRTQTVFARGTGNAGVCFVGEGPGADEDRLGFPFVGAAGQLLDKMIAAMGLNREDVYVCNIVKCRPPGNRKPLPDEMEACRPFLIEQLDLLGPRSIVALGATAATGLLGITLNISRLRGQWRLYRGRVPVMPTFHPSYLLRQPDAKREVWSDLLQVLERLGLPKPGPKRPTS